MKMKWLWIILALIVLLVAVYLVFFRGKENDPVTPKGEIKDIKSLHYSYSVGYAMYANYIYEIKCDDKCTIKIKPNGYSEEESKEYEISEDKLKEIINVLNKYEVSNWDGYSKSDPNVLDGDSFSFSLYEKDGTNISASGYMMWPDHYRDVKTELKEIFDSFIKEGDFKDK